jgi:hypothetical protein
MIWNPSDKTIGECDSKENDAGVVIHPDIVVEIGYGGKNKVILDGEVTSFRVDKKGRDRVLVINATEKGRILPEFTFLNIINLMASQVIENLTFNSFDKKRREERIRVGEDKLITNMTIRNNLAALKQLITTTKSSFYTRGGELMVIPATLIPRSPTVIDFDSGLLEKPEKIDNSDKGGKNKRRGFVVKTLPIPGLRAGSSIEVLSLKGETTLTGVIYETKIKFPSRGEAIATHKVAVKEAA